MKVNKIYCGDCKDLLKDLDNDSVDLTITSPPYDNLRTYDGFQFDFDSIARELYRVTKPGGVVVWIVSDATVNGSETGTSFRQALFFKECGFNIHDTMIWEKPTFTATGSLKVRYAPVFEYMFVFSKWKIKTFNPIKDHKNKHFGSVFHGKIRQRDGSFREKSGNGKKTIQEYGIRHNIWKINTINGKERSEHPAAFPVQLAIDHILSWSNAGDIVLDPFMGSGTTAVACIRTGRNFIGFELSERYCEIAQKRITEEEK